MHARKEAMPTPIKSARVDVASGTAQLLRICVRVLERRIGTSSNEQVLQARAVLFRASRDRTGARRPSTLQERQIDQFSRNGSAPDLRELLEDAESYGIDKPCDSPRCSAAMFIKRPGNVRVKSIREACSVLLKRKLEETAKVR